MTATNVDKLVADLEEVLEDVRKTPPKDEGDMVALYGKFRSLCDCDAGPDPDFTGLGQTSVGPHVVGKLAEMYLDVCLE